jgi:tRNA(adenine34) deaminase
VCGGEFLVSDGIRDGEDVTMMRRALEAANVAANHDDVPVGCVIVRGGEIVAVAENRREVDHDPTAHAEIVALRLAATAAGHWRLDDAVVYVTLEPCVMCAGALLNARVRRLVIGAPDEKAGGVGSRYQLLGDPRLLHEVDVTYDVCRDECALVLQQFFAQRR